MLVEQLIKDLKMLPSDAVVKARVYGSNKSRTIIHGPVMTERFTRDLRYEVVELILDRGDRKKRGA
jgi:hypothetical protein